jgi:hypothetical protein
MIRGQGFGLKEVEHEMEDDMGEVGGMSFVAGEGIEMEEGR